jgi:hypothetical protein
MALLAIKGHKSRGNEVIEILEMLGYINKHKYTADCDSLCFYGTKGANIIYYVWVNNCYEDEDTLVFTLEEFLEKFPYKIGDKVIAYIEGCLAQFTIQDMRWNYELNKVEYKICSSWLDTSVILPYKEETIDKANKSVFDANAQCCDIMNHLIKEETMEELIPRIDFDKYRKDKYLLDLGNYEIKEENGKTYAVRKQFEYPKTYKECCEVLAGRKPNPNEISFDKMDLCLVDLDNTQNIDFQTPQLLRLNELFKLLMCRNAYWKIAGEQLGLDKPWQYDMSKDEFSYAISYQYGYIQKNEIRYKNAIFAFPTSEMRDAFKENFDDDIEFCKEFL